MVVIVSDEHSSTPLQKQKLGETTFTNGGGILPPSKDEECQLNWKNYWNSNFPVTFVKKEEKSWLRKPW